jgi:hypothetical protein
LEPPPGVDPKRWAQVVTEVFGHATSLLSGSKNYLMKQLTQLYAGVGDDGWPTLHQLRAAVEDENINYARKSSNYQDTVLNRLDGLLLPSDDVFTVSSGYVDPSLIDQRVVFEFDGLASDVQNFLMEVLFAYVFEYRLANGDRGDGLRHVFFLDEGKRVFSVYKERQDASGIPPVDELTAKMREFGEGLVVADQEPGKLTESIKANTYVTVLLQMSDYDQFREVADSMDLSRRQRDVGQRLDVGEAIVQIGNASPVHVDLDDYDLDKSMTDADLVQHMSNTWQSLTTTDTGLPTDSSGTIGQPDTVEEGYNPGEKVASSGEEGEKPYDLAENEWRLLEDVAERPFANLSERYSKLSSTNKGHQAKSSLVEKGLLSEHSVRVSNGRMKLLELTDDGREVLGQRDIDVSRMGRGSVVHRYWQHELRDRFAEAGWDASIESSHADVGAERDGVSIACEVAMSSADREVDHVANRLDAGFDRVAVFSRDRRIADELQESIEEAGVSVDLVEVLCLEDVVSGEIDFSEMF